MCRKEGILLRKAGDVIGLSVFNVNSGQKLGVVKDLLFDGDWSLRGVVLEPGGFLRRGIYIPSEKILSIGEDAITVGTIDAVTSLDPSIPFHSMLGEHRLKGKPVITMNGNELGHVEDVYFEEEVGTIIGYELTDGFLSDILDGRSILPQPERITIGSHALVVPQEMEKQLKEKIEE